MNGYVLAPLAKADTFYIWCYITGDSEHFADRVEAAIFEACELVAESPLGGHTRRDLTSRSLRFWTLTRYPNYILVYRPETSPVQIIAVLHGKLNTRRILRQRK